MLKEESGKESSVQGLLPNLRGKMRPMGSGEGSGVRQLLSDGGVRDPGAGRHQKPAETQAGRREKWQEVGGQIMVRWSCDLGGYVMFGGGLWKKNGGSTVGSTRRQARILGEQMWFLPQAAGVHS